MNRRNYIQFLSVLMLFMFFIAGTAYPEDTTTVKTPDNADKTGEIKAETLVNWYDNLFFKDYSFIFQGIRSLGLSSAGGGEIGECIDTLRRIKDGDEMSWYNEWKKTADRVHEMAEGFERGKHRVSAREAYFRAAMYYRAAGFYMNSKENMEKGMDAWKKGREAFLKGIAHLDYVKPIQIPYHNTTLPGYFVKTNCGGKKPPLLIVHTGFDGTGEELFFEVALSAIDRGYNCLIFEGPGQGAALREKHLHFRYDWEKVVTPVVDFAIKRPDVDKDRIALMGISMGGYLAPRAAAFEHRLKACIANGGVLDVSEKLYEMPEKLIELLKTNPDEFNKQMESAMKEMVFVRWFFNNGMFAFGVDTPAELIIKAKQFNLREVARNIKCPTLIIQGEADTMTTGAMRLYNLLECPKTYLVFTRAETAQAHCQEGAKSVSAEKIFNWLDDIMNNVQ